MFVDLRFPCFLQSQCLINVCGDAVFASREGEITAVVPDLHPAQVRKHSDSPGGYNLNQSAVSNT